MITIDGQSYQKAETPSAATALYAILTDDTLRASTPLSLPGLPPAQVVELNETDKMKLLTAGETIVTCTVTTTEGTETVRVTVRSDDVWIQATEEKTISPAKEGTFLRVLGMVLVTMSEMTEREVQELHALLKKGKDRPVADFICSKIPDAQEEVNDRDERITGVSGLKSSSVAVTFRQGRKRYNTDVNTE